MKTISLYFSFLLLFSAAFVKAQVKTGTDPRFTTTYKHHIKSYYICDSLFEDYKNHWKDWWKNLHVGGKTDDRNKSPKFFTVSKQALHDLDSLGHGGYIPPFIDVYFGFTSDADSVLHRISAVIHPLVDPNTFKSDTNRWGAWSRRHIKGNQPVGFKIRFADLDSMYHLLNDPLNPMTHLEGYFAFHNKEEMEKNRISVVFRPLFKNSQKRVNNDQISCGKNNLPSRSNNPPQSYINIDFTNPCPPCDTSG